MRRRSRAWCAAAPAVAVGVVLALDYVSEQRPWPVVVVGLLDEPAHLLTAALLLRALPSRAVRRVWPWALVGSVLIDLDHLPLYTFAPHFSVGGRPPTHSLVTVVTLLLLAAVLPGLRVPLAGLSLGVCLHFVRDLATGPGVPLFWPVSDEVVRFPYGWYLGVLVLAALISTGKLVKAGQKV